MTDDVLAALLFVIAYVMVLVGWVLGVNYAVKDLVRDIRSIRRRDPENWGE